MNKLENTEDVMPIFGCEWSPEKNIAVEEGKYIRDVCQEMAQLNIASLYIEASKLGIDYDTMTLGEVRRQVDKMKKENLLNNVHTSPLCPPTQKNTRWQTYAKNPLTGKNTDKIRGKTKEELIDNLMNHYHLSSSHLDNLTLNELYHEWLKDKTVRTASYNTILKHEEHYKKYLKETAFFKKKVLTVDKVSLRKFCEQLILKGMTKHLWINVQTILNGMFNYAEEELSLSPNPVSGGIKPNVKFQQERERLPEKEVFNTEEQEALKSYLDTKFRETKDPAFLAIRLNLLMGLRIGELSSLRWEDIIKIPLGKDDNGRPITVYKLHICRSELTEKKSRKVYVANHTKTYEVRYIALVEEAVELIEQIRKLSSSDEWVFSRKGERLRNRQIEYVLDKYAERNNLRLKSSHSIRRTFASNLYAGGMPIKDISKLLGHRNVVTTEKYLFSITTELEKFNMLEAALSGKKLQREEVA